MLFRSKERGTRKDRAKSGASKRAGRAWGRKERKRSHPTPPSFFRLSFHFSLGQNRKSCFFQTKTLATQAKVLQSEGSVFYLHHGSLISDPVITNICHLNCPLLSLHVGPGFFLGDVCCCRPISSYMINFFWFLGRLHQNRREKVYRCDEGWLQLR